MGFPRNGIRFAPNRSKIDAAGTATVTPSGACNQARAEGRSVVLDGITHRYGATAVVNVSLDIRGGELVSLLGPFPGTLDRLSFRGLLHLLAILTLVLLLALTLIVLVVSFADGLSLRLPPPGYSFRRYGELVEAWQLNDALKNSLTAAVLATARRRHRHAADPDVAGPAGKPRRHHRGPLRHPDRRDDRGHRRDGARDGSVAAAGVRARP